MRIPIPGIIIQLQYLLIYLHLKITEINLLLIWVADDPVKMMISLQGMSYMRSEEEEDLEEELELFAEGELDTGKK